MDRRAIHDGFKNSYTIMKDNRKIILIPLSVKEVYESQVRSFMKREKKNRERKRESKSELKEREREIEQKKESDLKIV